MKLKDWLKQFENYSEAMLEKEVKVEAPNGLILDAKVKMKRLNDFDLNFSPENIEYLVVTY